MILQVRGTSGSGKTWVMQQVMSKLGKKVDRFIEGRKRPLFYEYGSVAVLGHYEIACGGCDTIGSVPQVFDVIERIKSQYQVIVCEGLLLSEDVIWVSKYPDSRIAFLNTSKEECLANVNKRQEAAGRSAKDPERVERKLETRIGTIERAKARLQAAGIYCCTANSRQCAQLLTSWIRQAIGK